MNSKKRVLILSTSPRKNGNSDTLAEEFARGAREAGHEVEKISLSGKEIRFCQGCLACQKTGRCIIHDDADAIVQEKMVRAQVLVFATPIYYYEMCGQMKTMLDRSNPLYSSDYAFRKVYLLATAAEDGDEVWQRAASGLEGWVECFPKARMAGVVFGGGATEVGAIRGSDAMKRAYEAGKAL
ncbi:flavodoxin family protein [Angelakisella massiliensis]|uniref:flavodoxin family protein n=1 Tax=Angelakisella massiliensis TaxID=1871018 RepID=UPI0008F92519|nr:flavodoxin family protein [Angelakisella massiliensis]